MGTRGGKRWSVTHIQALRAQAMHAGGEVKGRGLVTGCVTQCLKPGQLDGLAVERILIYRGNVLRPHWHHATEALLIVVRGSGKIILNRKTIRVREGHIISIPPRTIHGFATTGQQLEFIAIQRPGVCRGKREDLEVIPP